MSKFEDIYPHISTPPSEPVCWSISRRDGKDIDGQKVLQRKGRLAREVWAEHLQKYGMFCEFKMEQLEP